MIEGMMTEAGLMVIVAAMRRLQVVFAAAVAAAVAVLAAEVPLPAVLLVARQAQAAEEWQLSRQRQRRAALQAAPVSSLAHLARAAPALAARGPHPVRAAARAVTDS